MKNLIESLETRRLMTFTTTPNSNGTYTITDGDDVASDGGSRFFLYVSAGKYLVSQKDNSGNVIGSPVNLGANGAAGLTVNLGDGRDFFVTDSSVNSATTPNGTTITININGGIGNDSITGGVERDSVRGGDGDDSVDAGVGNDTIRGENGNDTMRGGSNSDYVYGDAGSDTLYGDNGNDRIFGGLGSDELFSGGGVDNMYDNTDTANDGVYDLFHSNGAVGAVFGADPSDGLVIDQPA